ncbi:MAG: SUMF1/EgtB/PvdO family nonheme iron enzyme [Planctomycetota bacterium]
MATASRLSVCCSTALLAGCCGPAWPPGGVERQAVAIDNPAAVRLVACCDADGDGDEDVRMELGTGARITTALPCAAWWLDASAGGLRWQLPLPLHRTAVRPATLELTVTPPPASAPLPGFVWIPPGPAVCGDVLGIGQEIERPARVRSFPGFWLGHHEVTNAEFAVFLDACGDAVDPQWLDLDSHQCRLRRAADGRWHSDAPQLPVVTVAHAGALAYCAHRTAATGLVHRLPSEWEWEKAARGPRSSTYAYGDVYRQAAANQESGELRPVGSHAPNGFGLVDMTGNAFEWVADVHPAADGANPAGAAPSHRVLRGGSFVLDGIYLRNSLRMKLRPGVRADDVGFRVLLEPTPP